MDAAGQRRALLFAMQEPGGDYRAANDEVARRAAPRRTAASSALGARVDRSSTGAVAEAQRAWTPAPSAIKLHPRSDAFTLPAPGRRRDRRRSSASAAGSVLFHAGRGIPNLGEAALDLAAAHPGVRIVLAHAGISDLGAIANAVGDAHNVFFDTAWWQVSDLIALFCDDRARADPARVATCPTGRACSPRGPTCGWPRAVGLGRGRGALDHGRPARRGSSPARSRSTSGRAPGVEALGPRLPGAERAIAHLTAAVRARRSGGYDPDRGAARSRASRADGGARRSVGARARHGRPVRRAAMDAYDAGSERHRAPTRWPPSAARSWPGTPWVDLP